MWRNWRADQIRAALNQIRPSITCPAWLEGGLSSEQKSFGTTSPGWLTRWAALGENNLLWRSDYSSGEKLIGSAGSAGATPWLRIPVLPGTKRTFLEDYLGVLEVEAGDGWQGRYMDLLAFSLKEVEGLLQ